VNHVEIESPPEAKWLDRQGNTLPGYWIYRLRSASARVQQLQERIEYMNKAGYPRDPERCVRRYNLYQKGVLQRAGGEEEQDAFYWDDIDYVGMYRDLAEARQEVARINDRLNEANQRQSQQTKIR